MDSTGLSQVLIPIIDPTGQTTQLLNKKIDSAL
jgi:hypothetical protein